MPLFCLLTSQTTFGFFPLYVFANAIEFFLPIEVFLCTSISSFLSWQLPLSLIFFYFCSFIIVSFCPFLPNYRTEIKRFFFFKNIFVPGPYGPQNIIFQLRKIEKDLKRQYCSCLSISLHAHLCVCVCVCACVCVCVCVCVRACVSEKDER